MRFSRLALVAVGCLAFNTGCPDPTPVADGGSAGDAASGADAAGHDAAGHDGAGHDAGGQDAYRRDAGELPNLEQGTWQIENVSNTTGTISHDGALAFTDDGTLWVAWSEPLAGDNSDQDIWTGSRGSSGWTATPFTSDVDVQNSFARLVASGDMVYLVYNGYPGGDNDIFGAAAQPGQPFSGRFDLTSPAEASGTRSDYRAELAIRGDGGEFAVAYLSAPLDGNGDETGPSDVRVLRFAEPSSPGTPETAIATAADEFCDDVGIAYDGRGDLHVVASCGPLLQGAFRHATDRSGSWVNHTILLGDTSTEYSFRIALDPDGSTLHVVFVGDADCGTATCSDIMYTRIIDGDVQLPVHATSTAAPADDEKGPLLAIDAGGRVLVAFQRSNASDFFDIFFTWSQDGAAWSTPRNVTNSADVDDWMLWSMAVDPLTQRPHLSYTKILAGTNPLDAEVMHAWLAP